MAKMLKILCRAQNVVYNVVSISGCELVGKRQFWLTDVLVNLITIPYVFRKTKRNKWTWENVYKLWPIQM